MSNEAPATSVLELLLHPNPTVSHRVPPGKSNSRGNKWHCPEKIDTWDELSDIKTLEHSFGGRLLAEARRGGRELPRYPTIHTQADCTIRNEKDTENLLNKWNKEVVNAALFATGPEFRAAIWCKGDSPPFKDESESPPRPKPERTQPHRGKIQPKTGRTQSLRGLKPDSGSILPVQSPPIADFGKATFDREVFPKEYKPAEKWRSKWIREYNLINKDGRWLKGKRVHNYAWPIKQAYTYCIQHMCRYGCILTCREAFIFRVKPLDKAPASGAEDPQVLRSKLIQNGLMEFVSIPWDNYHRGDVNNFNAWTVNLALWYMHILAAVDHGVKWAYDPLVEETLPGPIVVESSETLAVSSTNDDVSGEKQMETRPEKVDSEETDGEDTQEEVEDESETSSTLDGSEDFSGGRIPSGMKRKRDSVAEESIQFSFSKRPMLGT